MKLLNIALTLSFCSPLSCAFTETSSTSENQPNIVIIFADDFGYGDLSCYGATKIHTPVIDSLAGNGIRFTNGYVVSSLCSPSRYSLLTGRYSWRTHLRSGVIKTWAPPLIEEEQATLASMLKNNGYYTACIGKWHLGFNWALTDDAPDDYEESVFNMWGPEPQQYIDFSKSVKGGPIERGFDYFFGISGANNMMPFAYIENETIIEPPSIPNDFGTSTLKATNWDVRLIDQTFTSKAVEVIDQHFTNHAETPLFLYFPVSAIHRPCLPTFTKGMSRAGMRGDVVVEFDWMVDQIVQALVRNGQLDNTLLIITSDNGPQPGDPYILVQRFKNRVFGDEFDYFEPYFDQYEPEYQGNGGMGDGWLTYNHDATAGLKGFKADIWEGGLRVPFIVHWPAMIQNGRVDDMMICTVDIMATLAKLIGVDLPSDMAEDSYSFLDRLLDKDAPDYRKTLTMVSGRSGSLAIRKGDWKYIDGFDPDSWDQIPPYHPAERFDGADFRESQLYNLKYDPGERHNRLDSFPQVKVELENILRMVEEGSFREGW